MGLCYRCDHSPVSISFQFYNQKRGPGTWKFNNSLLYDPDYIKLIKDCIQETILQYSVPKENDEETAFSLDDQLLWEMLKLSIRGKTIAYSTHKKRSREQEERELEKILENLYIKFEQNPSVENDVYIREAEENLKNLREEKIKGLIARA